MKRHSDDITPDGDAFTRYATPPPDRHTGDEADQSRDTDADVQEDDEAFEEDEDDDVDEAEDFGGEPDA
jgi:hypothetical protein